MQSPSSQFKVQAAQYSFPYHHIPKYSDNGQISCVRSLDWGIEYLVCQQMVRQFIDELAPKSLMEVGCGDGGMIGAVGPNVPRRVGVDLVEAAIRFAKAFHPDVEFHTTDAAQIAETFDAVLCVEVLEHIPDGQVSEFLQVLCDRVATGGKLLLCVPTTNIPLKSKHFRHYTLDILLNEVDRARVSLKPLWHKYFYETTQLLTIYNRLCNNRLWTIEIRGLQQVVWRHAWKRAKVAPPATARHLFVLFDKI